MSRSRRHTFAPQDLRQLGRPVGTLWQGRRVDVYLASCFPFLSRQKWIERLRRGEVVAGPHQIPPAYLLRGGDQVAYYAPAEREPPINETLGVVWRHPAGLAIIDKPPNLPMHEGGAYRLHTFHQVLQHQLGAEWAAVHRLDRETSGLVLCAQTSAARAALSKRLREGDTEKQYFAIVFGQARQSAWRIDAPIGELPGGAFRLRRGISDSGLPSRTRFEVVATCPGYSLLRVFPETGRTHQIRIHAAASGHPLVGDCKYYPDSSIFLERMDAGFTPRVAAACLVDRLCLQAAGLAFPWQGERIECQRPLASDLSLIWTQLSSGELAGCRHQDLPPPLRAAARQRQSACAAPGE